MPINAFRVESSRMHDIKLEDGATVDTLRGILKNNGYDIDGTTAIRVRTKKGWMIGRVNSYQLKDGDCVSFKTVDVDFPVLRNFKDLHESPKSSNASCGSQCHCQHSTNSGCTQHTKDEDSCVRIERIPNGLIIRFN